MSCFNRDGELHSTFLVKGKRAFFYYSWYNTWPHKGQKAHTRSNARNSYFEKPSLQTLANTIRAQLDQLIVFGGRVDSENSGVSDELFTISTGTRHFACHRFFCIREDNCFSALHAQAWPTSQKCLSYPSSQHFPRKNELLVHTTVICMIEQKNWTNFLPAAESLCVLAVDHVRCSSLIC